MRGTTVIMIIMGVLIVLLLVGVIIQSQKKPGKKKTRNQRPDANYIVENISPSGPSSLGAPIRISESPYSYTVIPGSDSSVVPILDSTTPGLANEYNPNATPIGDDIVPGAPLVGASQSTLDVISELATDEVQGQSDLGPLSIPPAGWPLDDSPQSTESLESNITSDQSNQISQETQSTQGIRGAQSTRGIRGAQSTQSWDDDHINRNSYIPSVNRLKRIYNTQETYEIEHGEDEDELGWFEDSDDGIHVINLDDMGKELIPHSIERQYESNYNLSYSLYPINGISQYNHHHYDYGDYYMMVYMTLYVDPSTVSFSELSNNNYLLSTAGEIIRASQYSNDDQSVTLIYKIRNVDDYIPLHTSSITYNILEDRYLVPMLNDPDITISPFNYTNRIQLYRNDIPIDTISDNINGIYVIRV